MAGVAAPADDPRVGDGPDALAFSLDPDCYRWHRYFYICGVLITAVIIAMADIVSAVVAASILIVLAPGLASNVKLLALPDPVLLIDRQGVFDKRVTREAVPWSKINRLEIVEISGEGTLPNSFLVRVNVGNRRRAGIDLAPWTYFVVRRHATLGWDDIVIDPRGLAVTPPRDDSALTRQIVDFAHAMRARYAGAKTRAFAG